MSSNPEYIRWQEDLSARKSGEGIKSNLFYGKAFQSFLNFMNIDYDEFEASPADFIREFVHLHPRGLQRYVKAINSYCSFRNIKLPKSLTQVTIRADYSDIDLSDSQFAYVLDHLYTDEQKFMFLFITDTGSRKSVLLYPIKIVETKENIIKVDVFEKKLNKSFKKYLTNPVIFILINRMSGYLKNGFPVTMIKEFENRLKEIYSELQIDDDYFYQRPVHTLKHVSVHRLLRKYEYNYSIVAKLVGTSPEILRKFYGQMLDIDLERLIAE